MSPKRNVEIKARLADLKNSLEKVQNLSDKPEELLMQEDYFFNVPNGRLKLRIHEGKFSEKQLIHYDRDNSKGPSLCNYTIASCPDVKNMLEVLKNSLGLKGVVKKVRHLFFIGQTRIHIDEVENLGSFIEFEVVLTEDQAVSEGEEIANELMKKLHIESNDLISVAYVDLLLSNNK